jgi:hypothetical protein
VSGVVKASQDCAYTVGLYKALGHSEVLSFGGRREQWHQILNVVVHDHPRPLLRLALLKIVILPL